MDYPDAPTVEAAPHILTARSRPSHPDAKSLARVLLDVVAVAGDLLAVSSVTSHGHALGDMALAVARRVGIAHESFHLVLIGDVFRHLSLIMREAIAVRVHEDAPNVGVIYATLEPAVDAVILALKHAGVAITSDIRATFQAAAPSVHVFAT